MTLFGAFTERAPNKIFISMFLGALAGICYSFLIPIILNSIGSSTDYAGEQPYTLLSIEIANHQFGLLFVSACLLILIARTASQVLLIRVAQDVTSATRLKIYKRILKAPTDELEDLGTSRILAVITRDINQVISGSSVMPSLLVNSVTLIGLLSFLLFLNTDVFVLVIIAIIIGGLIYQFPMYVASIYFRKVRHDVDELYEGMTGLIYGSKELKLNHAKRHVYYDEVLEEGEGKVRKNQKKAETIARAGVTFGELVSFFVIGIVTFIFVNYYAITSQTLIGVIMALLYITSPITAIMDAIPQINMARISLKRVNEFIDRMSKENANQELLDLPEWETIKFKGVTYHYHQHTNNFQLGPIDIELVKGEITFIIGGNGSGKSTLSKIISLHYRPADGEVFFGETKVDASTINSCREFVSAIFTDFYLFDRLLTNMGDGQQDKIDAYLKELQLDTKVSIKDGKFSSISLSDGQKKRLALLVEFIEDRQVYIFDEWAADQDPLFKNVFYHKLLPDLKAKGKAVVVISHDDRYFDIADKVIMMEEGKVNKVMFPAKVAEESLELKV